MFPLGVVTETSGVRDETAAARSGPRWHGGQRRRVFAALWPRAHEAGAILSAQDDPAELSDARINSALRNNQAIVAAKYRGGACGQRCAGLADSFVELARDKNIPVADELSQAVTEAVAEENSSSHFAKRFATGLVTGNADDVASLSGTVAGDLFVFGDIRDVVARRQAPRDG